MRKRNEYSPEIYYRNLDRLRDFTAEYEMRIDEVADNLGVSHQRAYNLIKYFHVEKLSERGAYTKINGLEFAINMAAFCLWEDFKIAINRGFINQPLKDGLRNYLTPLEKTFENDLKLKNDICMLRKQPFEDGLTRFLIEYNKNANGEKKYELMQFEFTLQTTYRKHETEDKKNINLKLVKLDNIAGCMKKSVEQLVRNYTIEIFPSGYTKDFESLFLAKNEELRKYLIGDYYIG